MRRSLLLSVALAFAMHLWLFAVADMVEQSERPAVVGGRAVQVVAAPANVVAAAPRIEQPATQTAMPVRPVELHAMPAPRPAAARQPVRPPDTLPVPALVQEPREEPIPTYSTAPPPPFEWTYRLRRGMQGGEAVLSWQPGADRYSARLVGRLGARPSLDWSSSGGFDAAGIAPERFIVRSGGRAAQAANFQRSGRPLISYSGPRVESPLPAGAQDRLSWIVQLAGIASSNAARVAEDGKVELYVTGARGDAARWTFLLIGRDTIETVLGPVRTLRLLREAQKPYDTRAEVWLDPLRHHLPVRATFANFPGGEELELLVQETPQGSHREP